MSRYPTYPITHTHSFPRVSGDEPPSGALANIAYLFSPRERG